MSTDTYIVIPSKFIEWNGKKTLSTTVERLAQRLPGHIKLQDVLNSEKILVYNSVTGDVRTFIYKTSESTTNGEVFIYNMIQLPGDLPGMELRIYKFY